MQEATEDAVDAAGSRAGAGRAGPAAASATFEAPDGATPEAFLAATAAWPRGFWQGGGRWRAFAGRALEVTAPREPRGDGTGLRGDRIDRFEAVRRRAERALRDARPDARSGTTPGRRMYGGFSFYDAAREPRSGASVWEGFGEARFVLPAAEMEGGAAGSGPARLTIRRPAAPGEAAPPGPAEVLRAVARATANASEAGPAGTASMRDGAALDAWRGAVERALRAIGAGALQKVVLARTLEVELERRPDPLHLLRRLRRRNPESWAFLFEPRPGVAFFSAAPELVCAVDGRTIHATAVAGTVARGRDSAEDEALARRLLASDKDRAEHALVERDLTERLAGIAPGARAEAKPRVVRQDGVQHLRTDVRGRAADPVHILVLVAALHPTAAVCGYPRDPAHRFLLAEEALDRGWYAAPVGWLDHAGNGEFAPGLRSAVVRGNRARLFAGAGIVEGSRPDEEWEETRLKFAPALRVLGLAGERPDAPPESAPA